MTAETDLHQSARLCEGGDEAPRFSQRACTMRRKVVAVVARSIVGGLVERRSICRNAALAGAHADRQVFGTRSTAR